VTAFWIFAALLSAAAVVIMLWPLWRKRREQGRWSALGLAATVAIVPAAFALYLHVTTWDPEAAQRASQGARIVEQLAVRMQEAPDDIEGWILLARSYIALGRYAEALAAYREAWNRSPVRDNELKVAYAEAQVLNDRTALTGEAGRLFEEVVSQDPGNVKALWYGGLVALEAGREGDFRARWTRLLALNPPEEIANIVRSQLAELGAPMPAAGGEAAAVSGTAVQLNVTLGNGRSVEQLGPNAVLFIAARAPGGGPPLAAIRRPASAVPGDFTLSDADSIIAGRSLGNYDAVSIVARLSPTGEPTAQPGDWFAEAEINPKSGEPVALVIDQVVQ
jgi:cytochrome c-type biogenesis protein CcmH